MPKIDTEIIAAAFADAERLNEALDADRNGLIASHLRILQDDLAGRIKKTHPRFNVGAFEKACFPLQSERQKQAILKTLNR